MKTNRSISLVLLFATLLPLHRAQAALLSSAFTYQGRLTAGGAPANGEFDLRLTLYDTSANGNKVGASLTNADVTVSNGLFTITVDFGSAVFDGSTYWLETAVRPGGTTNVFRPLAPRHRVTGTPYALHAANAGTASSVAWSALTGVPGGFVDGVDNDTTYTSGAGLSLSGTQFSVNFGGSGAASTAARSDHTHAAQDLISGTLADARLSGTYSGTLRFTNPANGFSGGGGGLTGLNAANITSGILNEARVDSLIARDSEVWGLGGNGGTSAGMDFLGTTDNQALELKVKSQRALRLEPTTGTPNVIAGSSDNRTESGAIGATIGGGGTSVSFHRVAANYGTIGGGQGNAIQTNADHSTIGGGEGNRIETGAARSSIGGGIGNTVASNASVSTISGGQQNTLESGASFASIAGGSLNTVRGSYSTIAGGSRNTNSADYAAIPGGENNAASGVYSLAAGRRAKANHTGSFVWGDSSDQDIASTVADQFTVRANGGFRLSAPAGPTKVIDVGEHYRDNAIVAWARVNLAGISETNKFGVASTVRSSTGVYDVTLSATALGTNALIPIAIAEVDSPPTNAATVRIVSVRQTGPTKFSVYINSGNFVLVNNDFVFMATAR